MTLHLTVHDEDAYVTLASMVAEHMKANVNSTTTCHCSKVNRTITIDCWTELFQILQMDIATSTTTIRNLEIDINFLDNTSLLARNLVKPSAKITIVNSDDISSKVKQLSFPSSMYVGMNTITEIIDGLGTNLIGNCCTLTSLNLDGVLDEKSNTIQMKMQLAEKFVTLLKQTRTTALKELVLSNNQLGDGFVTILSNGLKNNTQLEVLKLNNNGITHIGAESLANALYYNTKLVDLCLRDNNMGDNGAIAVSMALRYHPNIKIISISRNNISKDCLIQAMEFLEYNESVQDLHWYQGGFCNQQLVPTIQSILNYNDSIWNFHMYINNRYSNQLHCQLNRNGQGTRNAPYKGLRRKQQIYKWLFIDSNVSMALKQKIYKKYQKYD